MTDQSKPSVLMELDTKLRSHGYNNVEICLATNVALLLAHLIALGGTGMIDGSISSDIAGKVGRLLCEAALAQDGRAARVKPLLDACMDACDKLLITATAMALAEIKQRESA